MFEFVPGSIPLLVSLPHVGTQFPPALNLPARLSEAGKTLWDTDWYVDRLWAFAKAQGAAWLQPHYSRYVVDLNRPSDDQPLYPGQVSTGLCPTQRFDGEDIYAPGCAPDAAEIAARAQAYWVPYHQQLHTELNRLRQQFGQVLLIDAHSIQSVVPRLFTGRLPDINLGTNNSTTLPAPLELRLVQALSAQQRFSVVSNGRFKGGYITRHYGQPAAGVYALQVELAQATYMDENTLVYAEARAALLIHELKAMVDVLLGR
jgi:N-formylglutamate deformylase